MSHDHADPAARIADLEREVAELRSLVHRLTGANPATETPYEAGPNSDEARSSRRNMLRFVGVAAAGAVAGAGAIAGRAAADDGPMLLGNAAGGGAGQGAPQSTADKTRFDWTPPLMPSGVGFLFQAGTSLNNNGSIYPSSVLAGWAGSDAPGVANGVYGYTANANGYGVIGVGGSSTGVGVLASGQRANLLLNPTGEPPVERNDSHVSGEIVCDSAGDVWVCVAAGTPGTWRKIAGPSTGGAFHAISPSRVYDSRAVEPAGNVGLLLNGSTRTVSVADQRDLTTGAVTTAGIVPPGATAVTANVTVTNTQGAGFLAINPGGDDEIKAAAVNWSTNGQILNNGLNLTLNGNREITIVCGGGGNTHVVVDITGYFR